MSILRPTTNCNASKKYDKLHSQNPKSIHATDASGYPYQEKVVPRISRHVIVAQPNWVFSIDGLEGGGARGVPLFVCANLGIFSFKKLFQLTIRPLLGFWCQMQGKCVFGI